MLRLATHLLAQTSRVQRLIVVYHCWPMSAAAEDDDVVPVQRRLTLLISAATVPKLL